MKGWIRKWSVPASSGGTWTISSSYASCCGFPTVGFTGPRATLLAILRKAIEWEADRLAAELNVGEIRFTRDSEHQWHVQLIDAEQLRLH